MLRPIIAIVGRPNVGKSTLFNRLVGRRQSLVRDVPGVTRDRLYGRVTFERWTATVIDTGPKRVRSFTLGRPVPTSALAPDWNQRSRTGAAYCPSGAFDENP